MNYFFLMCSERSGSNLISKMVGNHSKICAPSTSHVGDVIIPNLYSYQSNSSLSPADDIFSLLENKNAVWKRDFCLTELQNEIESKGLNSIFSYIYSEEAKANCVENILIKENRIYEYFGFLKTQFSNAKYIYMVRDPRAMAASWKFGYAMRGGVARAVKIWKQDQLGFLRVCSWLKDIEFEMLRYEDLLKEPEQCLSNICNTFGLSFEDLMLQYYKSEDAKVNSLNAKDWQNISKPLMQGNIDKYKELLTSDEISYVEYVCHREMQAFGYEPVGRYLSGGEAKKIEEHLVLSEAKEKPRYMLETTKEERNRRHLHFSKSKEIFSRPFKLSKLQNN